MNTVRPFESRLGEWLESGPAVMPDPAIDTVLAAFPAIRQRRPRLVIAGRPIGLGRRWGPLQLALAIAAALVLAIAGSQLLLPRPDQVGPPKIDLTPRTSFRYHYAVGYPTGWTPKEATRTLLDGEVPWASGPAVDLYEQDPDADNTPVFEVTAANVPFGTNADDVAHDIAVVTCGTPTSDESVTLDGENGRLLTYASCFDTFHQWVVVVHGGQAFHVVWFDVVAADHAVDRAIFDQILDSFQFTN